MINWLKLSARESKSLVQLCKTLIHLDPGKRLAGAEEAFDWTAKFKDEFVFANLATPWVKEIQIWIVHVKKSLVTAANEP